MQLILINKRSVYCNVVNNKYLLPGDVVRCGNKKNTRYHTLIISRCGCDKAADFNVVIA